MGAQRKAVCSRPTEMRPFAVLLILLLGVALAPLSPPAATASCADPTLELSGADPAVKRPLLARGKEFTVTGRLYRSTCQDTENRSVFGCSGGDERTPEPKAPKTDLELVLFQGQPAVRQSTMTAADVDMDDDLWTARWTGVIPADQPFGPAFLETTDFAPLEVWIVR